MKTGALFAPFLGLAAATSASAGELPLFSERFADNSRDWAVLDEEDVESRVESNGYLMRHKEADTRYAFWVPIEALDANSDYRIDARITKLEGEQDQGYGLFFGGSDPGRGFTMMISGNGQVCFHRYLPGEKVVTDLEWRPSPLVKSGNGETNTLSVLKVGRFWVLEVNGRPVGRVKARRFAGQLFGFQVHGLQAIRAESLTVTLLSDHKPNTPRILTTPMTGLVGRLRPTPRARAETVIVLGVDAAGLDLRRAAVTALRQQLTTTLSRRYGIVKPAVADPTQSRMSECDDACARGFALTNGADAVVRIDVDREGEGCLASIRWLDAGGPGEKDLAISTECGLDALKTALARLAETF